MANSVKFSKFKWDSAGYKEVKNSDAVQNILKSKANSVADAANKSIGKEGFVVEHKQGNIAGDMLYEVHVAKDDGEAFYKNLKHNTLLKALGSAK